MSDLLELEERDGVLVMTMHRPERRHAVDQALADALADAFELLETSATIRAGVLTGSEGYFSAGTDLSLDASPTTPGGGEYGFVRRPRTVPVVAAVEGFALGGGFEMVLACDLVVAAADARFGLPEVKRGVVANCGAFFRAPERLPTSVALELLLTGEPLPADRAHALGLVNRLVAPGTAREEAIALAVLIGRNGPAAVAATMRALSEARASAELSLWPLTERAAAEAAASPERAEGIAAFFEKREPRW